MMPSNRSNPQVASQSALPDKHITVYVLLAGVAGGLVLAVVVMVCCKVCLRKKKTLTREFKDFDPEEYVESGIPRSWPEPLPEPIQGAFSTEIELKELPKGRSTTKDAGPPKKPDELSPGSPSPERPPEVTSAVRRRSSVGIQRQASVCLSDEDEDHVAEESPSSGSVTDPERSTGTTRREVTKVSAVVHHSIHEKPVAHSWDQTSVGSSSSQPIRGARHPPFIHSHSSPDSGSTATVLEVKHGRLPSTISLRGVAADNLARVVDLEDYHYGRQQVWELASQGATLLKERSQSSLDVAVGNDGWEEAPSRIQQAASTEAGLLEQGLEHHQLENLRSILSRYSPVDEEEAQVLCKVRYNDTGSREDIREEVIEMISGESDDSSSSVESEIVKQQYKKLWELRATLEEEEGDLSDPQQEAAEDPPEDEILSLGHLDEQELLASQATSFESNVDVDLAEDCGEPAGDYLQLPTHELRRRCYKSLLAKRGQRRTAGDSRASAGGGESSFESVESSSTDRTEGATTSFESTTDNTDSTGEGQTNRLQQMKADSGYKSMESNGKAPRLSKKHLQFTLDGDSLDAMLTLEGSLEEEEEGEVLFEETDTQQKHEAKAKCTTDTAKQLSFKGEILSEVQAPKESESEVKKYKSALKKHRTESDIKLIEQQSLPEISSEARGKTSVFQRFFRSGRLRCDTLQLMRDYSIDEKSDALFREFSRPDEAEYFRSRSSRLHSHIRLHHRPLPPSEGGSPHLTRKVLSPQLSIEEESCESGEEHQSAAGEQLTAQSGGKDLKGPHDTTQAQIPVICLTQGKGERPT